MNVRKLAASVTLALALPLTGAAMAADAAVTATAPAAVETSGAGYLGVVLGPVPAALRTQLDALLPAGQGVMVHSVAEDSPAAAAGLHPYDIVVAYNDQRLFSADQFSQLVRTEGAGRAATLKLVHNGNLEERQVTLGSAPLAAADYAPRPPAWMSGPRPHDWPAMPMHRPSSAEQEGSWATFDSLTLNKREDGSYQAEIRYLDDQGKLNTQQFTGTRDEIRGQVMSQNGLPPVERDQLLEALSARDDGDVFTGPFGHHMFRAPWFGWQPDL